MQKWVSALILDDYTAQSFLDPEALIKQIQIAATRWEMG